jgi:spore coat protein A
MTTRRSVLGQLGALTAAATGALAPWRLAWSQAAPKLLDGRSVLKFQSMLPNPLAPEFLAAPDSRGGSGYTLYIREVQQWLGLATSAGPLPPTTVWGYGTATRPATYPGPTFDVPRGRKLRVTFVNSLVDAAGNPLPNRMPVDTTLEWANPGAFGGVVPVPAATHLHGGDNDYLSDGLPDAWSTPVGQVGRLYQRDYTYDNDQEAGFLWYHDHALGITRTNVYMGLAGLYFLRDEQENALRAANVLPSYPFEVPLVIQDRQFAADASLHYPATGKGMPTPTHLPEFFGDVLLVNTQAWPRLAVEQRKYRFRLLNGSDSRFYDLRVVTPRGAKLPLLVVGNELGLLDGPVTPDLGGEPDVLPIAPGERYDVVIDFAAVPAGTRLVMTNSARSPYPNGSRVVNGVTDAVMAFDVVPAGSAANASVGPGTVLRGEPLPPVAVPAGATRRRILMFEGVDAFGRLKTMLGPVDWVDGLQGTLSFRDPITERPTVGSTEVWEFYNATVDAHPLHMHLVDFRIVDRQAFTGTVVPKVMADGTQGAILDPASIRFAAPPRPPRPHEAGRKDTVIVFPGEVARVVATFRRAGEYVYHCHILSHEDHEMMRPYEVVRGRPTP